MLLQEVEISSQKDKTKKSEFPLTGIPKLRICFLIFGTRGDIQPYLALGVLLQKRGNFVRIGTHEHFRELVQSYDFEFVPIAGDPERFMKLVNETNILRRRVRRNKTWVLPMFNEVFHDCWDVCTLPAERIKNERSFQNPVRGINKQGPGIAFQARKSPFRADAIIATFPTFAGLHIAEALGVPIYMSHIMPWSKTESYHQPLYPSCFVGIGLINKLSFEIIDNAIWLYMRKTINDWRTKTLALGPINSIPGTGYRIVDLYRIPVLYSWSEQLFKPTDWGNNIKICGYFHFDCLQNVVNNKRLVEFLEDGDKHEAPIFIGFGSIVVKNPAKIAHIVAETILKFRGTQRFIIQGGWSNLHIKKEILPESIRDRIHHVGPVSHDWLFPQCKLIIHHGGAGTTAEALRAGIPMVVVPFFADQFLWARCVRNAGVGRVVPYAHLNVKRLHTAIKSSFSETVRQKALALRYVIQNENGASNAVNAIEKYFKEVPKQLDMTKPNDPSGEMVVTSDVEKWTTHNISAKDEWRHKPYVNVYVISATISTKY